MLSVASKAGAGHLPGQRTIAAGALSECQVQQRPRIERSELPRLCPGSGQIEKENTMLLLVIAMGAPLFAVIGYALLNPDQPAPGGS
jgi:hypothetical protein